MTGTQEESAETLYDLCVIGAGIAGLNALYVAMQYLPKGARVALIDRNARCGGMWNTTYDYVRLHQPHPMFTTGDVSWQIDQPPDYLATGAEVLDHLAHCFSLIEEGLAPECHWRCEVEATEELAGDQGAMAEVRFHRIGRDDEPMRLRARQVIDAVGMDVPNVQPLALSSRAVRSTTPERLSEDGILSADTPLYVVGGGKTGMDTVLAALAARPDRKVVLLAGDGTMFAQRTQFFPTGLDRLWKGKLLISAQQDMALRFDGSASTAPHAYFRQTYTRSPGGEARKFLFGFMSDDEVDRVNAGCEDIILDYLRNVVDGDGAPEMVLRSGERRKVEEGAAFVNCTGHLFRHPREPSPLLSDHGTILSITPKAAIHFLTSVSAYFLTHLLYQGRLRKAPLAVLDLDALKKAGGEDWYVPSLAHAYLNTLVLLDQLPFKVMDRCGLDFDRWHPLYRRALALVGVKLRQKAHISHCRDVLETRAQALGVNCYMLA